jgi:hypothetical protein
MMLSATVRPSADQQYDTTLAPKSQETKAMVLEMINTLSDTSGCESKTK